QRAPLLLDSSPTRAARSALFPYTTLFRSGRPVGGASLNGADNAGDTQATVYRDAPGFKLAGHQVRRAVLFVGQFGMGMNVTANGSEFGVPCGERFNKLHKCLRNYRCACIRLFSWGAMWALAAYSAPLCGHGRV